MAVLIPVQIAWVLVVHIQAVTSIVVVDVAPECPEGGELWTDLSPCVALAVGEGGSGRVEPNLVASNMVVKDVIGHSDHVDPTTLSRVLTEPGNSANLPSRADDCVVADDVVHLVAILREDASCSYVPKRVLVDQRLVRSMDRDADLLRVDDCIPLEDALWALTHHVQMQAILPHLVPTPTVLDAGVSHINDAAAHHACGEALQLLIEVIMITCDDYRPFQIHNLGCDLEHVPFDLGEAAPVI
eukprot:CAMPEP_0115287660 /NCGR_PEP_ID=MMETSP0270-20121206/62573_1 /TAXON_ID=71861 /ORGANISM="Scrippsiella trochoidea, Strain CCMP3099" /LENGTH=242 /DNA_ID=CAMNT_0002704745 /DNA_START=90 /DNA_END=818 /DNA_ORIENTATION=-